MTERTVKFTDRFMFREDIPTSHIHGISLLSYRDELCSKLNRQIGLLLESKKPKKQNTNRGRLDTRLAYRMPFNDTIFSKHKGVPSSDTTIVFLVDGSGSMDTNEDCGGQYFSRIQLCSAVCSAFAKSVSTVLKDQIKVEVMVKSAPTMRGQGNGNGMEGVRGGFVTLTRVFSNNKTKKKDFDKLLQLQTNCPLGESSLDKGECFSVGSYTAEYSVLPCLMDWAKQNITTRNMVVFNLTDGESYARLGSDGDFVFTNKNTGELKRKYLRGVPNMTLLVGNDVSQHQARKIYGQDLVVSDDSCFVTPMIKNLINIIDGEVN
tara:strand:- start:2434 stop:3393 length:960 start_codon:yes stop_codon:yes gene_type:complete